MSGAAAASWLAADDGDGFGLDNVPFGAVAVDGRPFPATRIGATVLDLDALARAGVLDEPSFVGAANLNGFLAQGRPAWRRARERLAHLASTAATSAERAAVEAAAHPLAATAPALAVRPGDLVDFYASLDHATNLGRILRPGGEPLLPNYRHIPIGYHGRAGTVVPSGTAIVRPQGQTKAPNAPAPAFGPTRQLDLELEMAWVAGPGNRLGTPIPADDVREHVVGYALLNDWSARDVQAWEYQPLGPFLGKSFATTLGPWIVTLDALEPFRVARDAPQTPEPLPYLRPRETWLYDIALEVALQSAAMAERGLAPVVVARSSMRGLYWDLAQQLAHATSNGATIAPGDLFGSGTISGPDHEHAGGSLIERTWRGARPLRLPTGEERGFLEDGDTVVLRAHAERDGRRISFGELTGTVLPAVAEGTERRG